MPKEMYSVRQVYCNVWSKFFEILNAEILFYPMLGKRKENETSFCWKERREILSVFFYLTRRKWDFSLTGGGTFLRIFESLFRIIMWQDNSRTGALSSSSAMTDISTDICQRIGSALSFIYSAGTRLGDNRSIRELGALNWNTKSIRGFSSE